MDNLTYLFAAVVCIWIILVYYIVRLARKQTELMKDIQHLQEQLKELTK